MRLIQMTEGNDIDNVREGQSTSPLMIREGERMKQAIKILGMMKSHILSFDYIKSVTENFVLKLKGLKQIDYLIRI